MGTCAGSSGTAPSASTQTSPAMIRNMYGTIFTVRAGTNPLPAVRQATYPNCTSGLATDSHISHTQSPSRLHGFVLSWARTATGPKGCRGMVQGNVTDGDVTELVRNTADAASAYIRGDIRRYLTLIKHGDDYTLMAPYGGEPRHG